MSDTNGIESNASATGFNANDIIQALGVVHDPSTKNEIRLQASSYLQHLKESQHAFHQGYLLGRDRQKPPVVRHYGLSLLEHVIKHQAHRFTNDQGDQLRRCVIELGKSIDAADPAFIRNKVAELWIELAKRTWALDWYNLDELLHDIWATGDIQKDFVLTVLENLSEDIFVRDDSTAVLRGRDLSSALVEIFTSSANYTGGIKIGGETHKMRYSEEGWLFWITEFLKKYLGHESPSAAQKATAVRCLATIRSAFVWIMSPSIVHAESLPVVCNCLMQTDTNIIIAALDALITLYGRHKLEEIEIQALVHPLCQASSVATLSQVYSWSVVGTEEIESAKYLISKKLSELMSLLCESLTRFSPPQSHVLDVSSFLHFIISIAEHESLIVSIPAMHSWVKLLEASPWRKSEAMASCVAPLLKVVSTRLIQYDQLPDDTEEPAVVFVNDEIEIYPERQGFYLNYRKLCSSIVEWICYTHLEDAIGFVLSQVDSVLDEIERTQTVFNQAEYHRVSEQVLKADAQFAIVDSAFKGLDRWQNANKEQVPKDIELMGERVRENAKTWASNMLTKRNFQDPQIKQRQLKTAVEISSRALQKDTAFAFAVLEHTLSSFPPLPPDHSLYSDAVADLHAYATNELRRLALQHADYFVTFYDQLESKFQDIISRSAIDAKIQVDLKSILFLIVQRASSIDEQERKTRMWSFLEPLLSAWNDDEVKNVTATFENFLRSQAFDRVLPFMRSMQAAQLEDWSVVSNSSAGMDIQQQMSVGYHRLPLRETRVLLSISTERLEQDSTLHKTMCELWSPMIEPMLSAILQVTRYNHLLHDPSTWPNASTNDEAIIKRIMKDRYWQSGISEGSMNEFHMKVKTSKASLEGFASFVRGRIRSNLEQCYSIIHTLGRLGASFYDLPRVPDLIAEALLSTVTPLSPHHFSVLLLMLPKLIEECPYTSRQHFLTPVLSTLLSQTDQKLTQEWQKLDEKKQTKHDEENLSEEMRDDSVLRQTTYKAVSMVSFWVDPRREEQLKTKKAIVNGIYSQNPSQTMRDFVLSNIRILEPMLLFCTHSLTYKDTKACQTMLRTAQLIVPVYATEDYLQAQDAASVREYISTEMLKAAITSLNDGYYADYQQYFAQLIAYIWLFYGLPANIPANDSQPAHVRPALSETPRNILLSLPGMTAEHVDAAGMKLLQDGMNFKNRRSRAIILSLLEDVRGVRLSELGKIDTRQQQSRILEKYKQREELGMQGMEDTNRAKGDGEDGVDLGGVADMFGGGT